ncbi:hypothetical protein NP095_12430 [Aeromicrobium duanguangcaii]|uniref:Uncharacterized protein n=1 Tax=Aeromicrobium duanguangcaii TaxID=2968086 RepID=A0ABY5KFU9_9ACTN|nr:hypothetical protein [Aeromicrobium duanguangcaii]UUI68002.1 hypothetical protein NP095_12430 [Aeromicrobium duanguangcaii]
MLSRTGILAHLVVAAALVAFVLIFTDRGGFAWLLAVSVFAGGIVGDLAGGVFRARQSGR